MNNEKFIEERNRKNEMFVSDITSKESFVFSWHTGAVIPITHPRYYDGRINVEIRKIHNNSFGNINFEKDEYQVSDDIVNKLYSYVENNIEKLIKLALNQTTKMYEGVSDKLSIKFKSVYISLSRSNAISEEEKNEITNIKNDIKNIITSGGITDENSSSINVLDIENAVNEIVGNDNLDKNRLLIKLVNKIIQLPENEETTITKLMHLRNEETEMIDPLIQGEIFNSLKKVCEKINIKIEVNHDEIGGLGYQYKFKKVNE